MKLEDIGFYTLSDKRAGQASATSPLWRCELLVTDRCNFKCPYYRGLKKRYRGDIDYELAMKTLRYWIRGGLKNVRFSGGEPTMYPYLSHLVQYCRDNGVERIAISTNGSADWKVYEYLHVLGVNDFSISLDSCCVSTGLKMMGADKKTYDRVISNIAYISSFAYTTLGVVITKDNQKDVGHIIDYGVQLGVKDVRIIPSAQENGNIDASGLMGYNFPILNYRINNIRAGRHVRGIRKGDNNKCPLALDDMAVVQGYHFPCIIWLREGGEPIGSVNESMRYDRLKWYLRHDSHRNRICKKNCLDVCIDYNNKFREIKNNENRTY